MSILKKGYVTKLQTSRALLLLKNASSSSKTATSDKSPTKRFLNLADMESFFLELKNKEAPNAVLTASDKYSTTGTI